MSKQREKKVVDNNSYTKEDAERILAEYTKSLSTLKGIEAEMELEIANIRSRYQNKIDKLSTLKEEAFDKLQVFAETNMEMFEIKKSMEMSHGKIGFRTGTPKLKLLKSFNWDRVVEKLEAHLPEFVRTKKEADKEKLLSSREDAAMLDKFKLVGVEVVQDESFYIEPKTEEVAV